MGIPTALQLVIYNKALHIIGERALTSLTENREPRRVLDDVWDSGNMLNYVLEEGMWKFSLRASKMIADPAIHPQFGYPYGFQQPTDFVRIAQLCSDEWFNIPLTEYVFEAGVFYSIVQNAVFLQYVSNDPSYGLNTAIWPETFKEYLGAWMAARSALRLTQSEKKEDRAFAFLKKLKDDALSKNALQGPTQFTPQGSWVSARYGSGIHRDRGNRGSFYG